MTGSKDEDLLFERDQALVNLGVALKENERLRDREEIETERRVSLKSEVLSLRKEVQRLENRVKLERKITFQRETRCATLETELDAAREEITRLKSGVSETRKTIPLRIAVAVSQDGRWAARGWGPHDNTMGDEDHEYYAIQGLVLPPNSERPQIYWISAEIPEPTPRQVRAIVIGDDGEPCTFTRR